jgi:hypothetical protein
MALVAHYEVLEPGSITLAMGDEHRLLFNPENDAYLEDTGRRQAILSYMVDPSSDASGPLELEVFARLGGRDRRISLVRVTGGQLRTVNSTFNPAGLSTGDNRILFKVTSGAGSLRIYNVVMWYQRNLRIR